MSKMNLLSKTKNGIWVGNRCLFGDIEFWPERGLIHLFSRKTNRYESISVREALLRLKSICECAGREVYPSDRKRMLDFCDEMLKCCKIAKRQGDPNDLLFLPVEKVAPTVFKLPELVTPVGTFFNHPVVVT